MEVKKSYEADLEHQWKKRFLLGLVLVLAVLVVALELNFRDGAVEYNEELLDDIVQELELKAAVDQEDMIAVMEEPEEEPAPPTRLNPVDEPVMKEAADRLAENRQELFEGETEATEQEKVPPIPPVAIDADNNSLNFRVVERLPEFPGGMTEFMKWLTKNLKYPESARRQNQQGTVVISFIVNTDGSTSEIRVVRPRHPDLDREAVRVVRMMPKWKPGEDHGKVCRTMISIPIVFKI
ncbi:MAG: energy transducer TonB [Prevotella sp.]|nr:energy transducer TonB [Prevotella sp.]